MSELTKHQETSLIEFPCDFTLKVFGKATNAFEIAVLTIIKKHVATLQENAIRQRYSKDKNYLSLSVTIHAHSKAQLDAIYQDLTKEPCVIMAL